MNLQITEENKLTNIVTEEVQNDILVPGTNKCFDQPEDSNLNNLLSNTEIIDNCNLVEKTSSAKSKGMKTRKKDDCSVQHVLRALNSLTTPEEKLAAMCKKYADLFDENRKLQGNVKQYQKQINSVIREKDQVRSDLAKLVLSRSKLESLCRELQRQNREIKEESYKKIREEEEKRKEVSAKFQITLNEITELMKKDSDKTMKLRDDNIDMTSKLKSVYEQYEIREQQIEKMAKQMMLESQLYDAKIAKLEMETAAEKEMLLREKQQLLLTLSEYQTRFQEYQNIEMTLRNQVALYNSKYEEFEKSLTKSNKMFGCFKEEMEIMSNKIVKLESETAAWKLRWEKTQKALIEMASEKQKSDQEIVIAAKQMSTLHKLCRTLQSERTQLLAGLKQNNISPGCVTSSEDSVASNSETGFEPDYSTKAEGVNEISEKLKNCHTSTEKSIQNGKGKPAESRFNKKSKRLTCNMDRIPNKKLELDKIENKVDTVVPSKSRNESNNVEVKSSITSITELQKQVIDTSITDTLNVQFLTSENVGQVECYQKISGILDENYENICKSEQTENILHPLEIHTSRPENQNISDNKDTSDDYLQGALNLIQNSPDESISTNSSCDMKQFSFPQTDTFSFTYNGNVLNELKCDPKTHNKNDSGLLETNTNSDFTLTNSSASLPNCSLSKSIMNSKECVLKKSTHSSMRKVSPKKKNRK